MLNALTSVFDRFRTAPPPAPSSTVARIEEELGALALSQEIACRDFADCCLQMVGENPDLGAAERLHQAEIARDALDRRGTQLRTALQAAHERDLSDANTAATAARAAGWRDVGSNIRAICCLPEIGRNGQYSFCGCTF